MDKSVKFLNQRDYVVEIFACCLFWSLFVRKYFDWTCTAKTYLFTAGGNELKWYDVVYSTYIFYVEDFCTKTTVILKFYQNQQQEQDVQVSKCSLWKTQTCQIIIELLLYTFVIFSLFSCIIIVATVYGE